MGCSSHECPFVLEFIPTISTISPRGWNEIVHMMHRWKALILLFWGVYVVQSHDYISERNLPMYTLNGWWFLSSGGAYPPVFTVAVPNATASHCVEHQRHMCTVCGHPTMGTASHCVEHCRHIMYCLWPTPWPTPTNIYKIF